MSFSSYLLVAGGAVYVALGGAHALWSLADVRRPRRFAPSDPEALVAMRRSTVRLTAGRTTMWDAWLGFNLSHGLGAVVFGCVGIYLGLLPGSHLGSPVALIPLVGISMIYLLLAVRFWFFLPVIGIGIATACFATALALTIWGGS